MYLCSITKEIIEKPDSHKTTAKNETDLTLKFASKNFLRNVAQLNIHQPTVDKYNLLDLIKKKKFFS